MAKPDEQGQGGFREVQIQGTDAQTGEQVTFTARVNPGGQVKLTVPDAPAEQPAEGEPHPDQSLPGEQPQA